MSLNLKRTLYIGLSALMIAGLGAGASNVKVNASQYNRTARVKAWNHKQNIHKYNLNNIRERRNKRTHANDVRKGAVKRGHVANALNHKNHVKANRIKRANHKRNVHKYNLERIKRNARIHAENMRKGAIKREHAQHAKDTRGHKAYAKIYNQKRYNHLKRIHALDVRKLAQLSQKHHSSLQGVVNKRNDLLNHQRDLKRINHLINVHKYNKHMLNVLKYKKAKLAKSIKKESADVTYDLGDPNTNYGAHNWNVAQALGQGEN